MISWFRFVVHAEVAGYKRQGWIVAAHLGPVHGAHAVLMRWAGKSEQYAPTEIAAERDAAPPTLRVT